MPLALDKAARQTDIGNVQRDHLAHAHPGGIKQLQHGLVAVALDVHALRLLKKQLDLSASQDLRELFLRLWLRNVMYGVFRHQAGIHTEAIEALERGDGTRDRGGGFSRVDQVLHIAADALAVAGIKRQLFDILKIGVELPDVTHVRGHRVRGCVLHIQKIAFIR